MAHQSHAPESEYRKDATNCKVMLYAFGNRPETNPKDRKRHEIWAKLGLNREQITRRLLSQDSDCDDVCFLASLMFEMTDKINETSSPASEVAGRLADELGLFTEVKGIPYELSEVLTPVQNALISDTFGLLSGISCGSVSTGQARIQTNIVRVISELPETSQAYDPKALASALSSVLARASGAGLTAENQPLNQLGRSKIRSC